MATRWKEVAREVFVHEYRPYRIARDGSGRWTVYDIRTNDDVIDPSDFEELPVGVVIGSLGSQDAAVSPSDMPIDFYNENGAEITINFSGGKVLDSTGARVIDAPQTWKRVIPAGDPAHDYQVGANGRMMGDGQPVTANTCYALYVATGTGGTDYICFPDTVAPSPPQHYSYEYIRRIGFFSVDAVGVPLHFRSTAGRVDFVAPQLIGSMSGTGGTSSPGSGFLPADRRAVIDSGYTYASGANPSYQLFEGWQSPPPIDPINFGWVTSATVTPATGLWEYREGEYRLDAARTLRARLGPATGQELRIWARGWIDDFRNGT